jgi:hypothetical protein
MTPSTLAPAQQPSPPRHCVDCRYYRLENAPSKGSDGHLCTHTNVANCVTGAPCNCHQSRSNSGGCGPTALLFVRRDGLGDAVKTAAEII